MTELAKVVCSLINQFAPNEIGVEIGVNRGKTSESILNHTTTKLLHMVDPWIRNYDKGQGLYSTRKNTDPDVDHQYVVGRFAKDFPDRHKIVRKKSEEASEDVPNDLGFIFIDGNHTYDFVMKDLELWVPKVKSGGLVMGHDWWSKFLGVVEAVTDFCRSNDVFLPPNHEVDGHVPAPSKDPVVMKSWGGERHLWWAIKK